jgi:hypothetical protein
MTNPFEQYMKESARQILMSRLSYQINWTNPNGITLEQAVEVAIAMAVKQLSFDDFYVPPPLSPSVGFAPGSYALYLADAGERFLIEMNRQMPDVADVVERWQSNNTTLKGV